MATATTNTWSIRNIDNHLEGQVWESFATHNLGAGMLLGTMIISLSYMILHKIYIVKSPHYREQLGRGQQLVVLQHSVEAVFLGLIYVPYTYLTLSVFFQEQPLEVLGNKVTALGTFMTTIAIMYLIELASRFANPRPLVVAHHLCAVLQALLTAFLPTTAILKSAAVLNYFVTYEAITFVGLIMYRLAPTHKLTRPTILVGMIVFDMSRPVQFVWIIETLWLSWDNLVLWQAVLQIAMTVIFTLLQLYSINIHWKLYQKCGANKKGADGVVRVMGSTLMLEHGDSSSMTAPSAKIYLEDETEYDYKYDDLDELGGSGYTA